MVRGALLSWPAMAIGLVCVVPLGLQNQFEKKNNSCYYYAFDDVNLANVKATKYYNTNSNILLFFAIFFIIISLFVCSFLIIKSQYYLLVIIS